MLAFRDKGTNAMWARIKRSIAIWLCPQLGKDSNAYSRIISGISADRHWVSQEFPQIGDAYDRLLIDDFNYWRTLDEMPIVTIPTDISNFREYLRRKYKVVS